MDLTFANVRAIEAGIWVGALSADDAAELPDAPLKIAGPHVLLLDAPQWNGRELKAPFKGVSVVALGNGNAAIYLSAASGAPAHGDAAPLESAPAPRKAATNPRLMPVRFAGDDEAFIYGCEEIGTNMVRVARALMTRVRQAYAGALVRTESPRRFVETPDNFWGVEIQPRKGTVKLVVRTSEAKLKASGIAYQSERPPSYFAVLIQFDGDVETALKCLSIASLSEGSAPTADRGQT